MLMYAMPFTLSDIVGFGLPRPLLAGMLYVMYVNSLPESSCKRDRACIKWLSIGRWSLSSAMEPSLLEDNAIFKN